MLSALEFQRLFFVRTCFISLPISRRSRSHFSLFTRCGFNRNIVNHFLAYLRARMDEECELEHPLRGTVASDENYFGPRRVKG